MTAPERSLHMLGWAIATISLSLITIYAIEMVYSGGGIAHTPGPPQFYFQPTNQGQPATTVAPASR